MNIRERVRRYLAGDEDRATVILYLVAIVLLFAAGAVLVSCAATSRTRVHDGAGSLTETRIAEDFCDRMLQAQVQGEKTA